MNEEATFSNGELVIAPGLGPCRVISSGFRGEGEERKEEVAIETPVGPFVYAAYHLTRVTGGKERNHTPI